MCGIMGFSRLTPTALQMAPLLAWDNATRGVDSWGMTNGDEVIRKSGPQIEDWTPPPESWMDHTVVWHNRGASFRENASDPNCAHPFSFTKEDGSQVIGVHNGIIRNHTDLNKLYKREFPVDSMHVFANIAEGKPWKDLEGWANLVWFETLHNKRDMYLARVNDQDLHVAKMKDGTLTICSTEEPIRWAGRMYSNPVDYWFKIDENQIYRVVHEEGGGDTLWRTGRKVEFKNPVKFCTFPQSASHSLLVQTSVTYSPCKICFRIDLPNYQNQAICEGCFLDQVERWFKKEQGGEKGFIRAFQDAVKARKAKKAREDAQGEIRKYTSQVHGGSGRGDWWDDGGGGYAC
jgi:hypothetical protein